MSQQFTVQSEAIRDKLNSLLPSQGTGAIGVELTGSTQIIPIVDLTEIAEGSNLREDLQTSFSHVSSNHTELEGASSTIENTTGYYRVSLDYTLKQTTTDRFVKVSISDGTTTKIIFQQTLTNSSTTLYVSGSKQFNVLLTAGDSLIAESSDAQCFLNVTTRQIADLSGNLVNPT